MGIASEKLYRNTLNTSLSSSQLNRDSSPFFLHRSCSFLRGKPEMAVNTEYGKSVQGVLKILELVSISRKIKPFL